MKHERLVELEAMLAEDGVPMEELKEAFILVNKEVLRHPELVDMMGAPEVGLVTAAAKRLLNVKLETETKKKESKKSGAKSGVKSAKAQVAAMVREAEKNLEDRTKVDWSQAL